MVKRAHTTFDVDSDTLANIRQMARDELRSMSQMVRILLDEALAARRAKQREAA
jgi:hypothetical protein